MNYYQNIEKQLELSNISIFSRYDYNEETFKSNPNLDKLEFGVLVENVNGITYDVFWDNDSNIFISKSLDNDDIIDESGINIDELIEYIK
jgi:hypothetical protein